MVRALLCTITLISVGWVGAGVAAADEVDVDLSAPDNCASPADVQAQIAAASQPDGAAGSAAIRIEKSPAEPPGRHWTASVSAGGVERVVTGATCAEVSRAAALIVGLALRGQPGRVRPTPTVTELDDAEIPPGLGGSVEPSEALAQLARSAPQAAKGWPKLAAHGSVGAIGGTLPELGALVRVGVSASGRRAAARVAGSFATSQRALQVEGGQEVVARVSLWAASASGCLVAGRIWLCGGAEIGRLEGEAEATGQRDAGEGLWLAASIGPSMSLALSRAVELVFEGEAAIPVVYPEFSVNSVNLPGPSSVSLRTGLGLRVQIP